MLLVPDISIERGLNSTSLTGDIIIQNQQIITIGGSNILDGNIYSPQSILTSANNTDIKGELYLNLSIR